jgi:putative spermidine/putrescine transport system permease protein
MKGVRLLLIPPLLFLVVFFVYPIAAMLERSFSGGVQTYVEVLRQPVYLLILANTFRIAGIVTAVCLLIGYPTAYYLTQIAGDRAPIYLAFVAVPYFTSVLVRTYAWMVLLGNDGLINHLLLGLHVVSSPVKLLYTDIGVVVGMSYVLLPYMIIALYAVMHGIDKTLVRAAAAFGAGPWERFRRVFFPLSLPGVVGGSLLVFIIALGFFITPALMGGPSDQMIAMLIQTAVEQLLNWNLASVLGALLLAATVIGLIFYDRLVGLEKMLGRGI